MKNGQGLTLSVFFVNFERLMSVKKASFHERFVALVIAAILAGLFIKTLFF